MSHTPGRWSVYSTPNSPKIADLIAAAPELLEALEAVVAVADRATVEFDQARAAIAKAQGVDSKEVVPGA